MKENHSMSFPNSGFAKQLEKWAEQTKLSWMPTAAYTYHRDKILVSVILQCKCMVTGIAALVLIKFKYKNSFKIMRYNCRVEKTYIRDCTRTTCAVCTDQILVTLTISSLEISVNHIWHDTIIFSLSGCK